MPGPAHAGAVIYAKHLAPMSAFYRAVLGMRLQRATPAYEVIESDDFQLVVHAIPEAIARSIVIDVPPVTRDEQAIKLFFTVPSIAAAREAARQHGGDVGPNGWSGPGFVAHNGHDPEGNIFQLREPALG